MGQYECVLRCVCVCGCVCADLVAAWPAIRHQRASLAPAGFYDAVGDQASRLVNLIEIRRQRRSTAQ